MLINEASKRCGLPQETLRYYEWRGVILPIARNQIGVRDYSLADCSRIKQVKKMREEGFSLRVIKDYMALLQQGDSRIQGRVQLLMEQREKLKRQRLHIDQLIGRLDGEISNLN